MTEVPEHLLARSRARRAALGLGGEGGDVVDAPATSESTEVEAAASAPAKAAAATPAVATPKEPEPLPPYVEAAVRRRRVPYWAMPVLAFLPVWGVLYAQSLSAPETKVKTQLVLGGEIYAAKCASCHGGSGGGGVGRPLAEGEVLKTFPNIEQQLEFVALGDAGFEGGYGDPQREGGQHAVGEFGNAKMPAFGESLKPAELLAVVRYEREVLSGEKLDAKLIDPATTFRLHADGKPYLNASGELLTSDGEPLFDDDFKLTAPEQPFGAAATAEAGGDSEAEQRAAEATSSGSGDNNSGH